MNARALTLAVLVTLFGALPVAAQMEEVVYYHTDAIGSVRMTTDPTGAVLERYDHLPFGELWDTPDPEKRQFAGKGSDAETGLDYFGARYLRAQSGRFTSVDPVMNISAALADPQRWNRYSYSVNGPLRYVDPNGKDPITVSLVLWGLYETGSALYDAYAAYQAFRDPNAGTAEIALALGGVVASAVLPGGGYGAGSRAIYRSSVELGHRIQSIGQKIENILTRNLNATTIDAAVREMKGEIVAINPKTGKSFDHITKVRTAAQGLMNQAEEIKRLLASGDLSQKARGELESQLRRANTTISQLEALGFYR